MYQPTTSKELLNILEANGFEECMWPNKKIINYKDYFKNNALLRIYKNGVRYTFINNITDWDSEKIHTSNLTKLFEFIKKFININMEI